MERDVKTLDFSSAILALPFVECLRQFDKVVSACFGQSLNPGYSEPPAGHEVSRMSPSSLPSSDRRSSEVRAPVPAQETRKSSRTSRPPNRLGWD